MHSAIEEEGQKMKQRRKKEKENEEEEMEEEEGVKRRTYCAAEHRTTSQSNSFKIFLHKMMKSLFLNH